MMKTFLLHQLPSPRLCDYFIAAGLLAYWIHTVEHNLKTIVLAVYMVLFFLGRIIYTAYIERGNPCEEQMNIGRREHGPLVMLDSERLQLLLGLLAILVMATDD